MFQFVLMMAMINLLAVLSVNAVGGIDELKAMVTALDAVTATVGLLQNKPPFRRVAFEKTASLRWMPEVTEFASSRR